MREAHCWGVKRKGVDQCDTDSQGFSTVDMSERGGVCDNGVRDEGTLFSHHLHVVCVLLVIRCIDTRPPETVKHLCHGSTATPNVSRGDCLELRNHARVFDHECHQL